MSCDLGESRYDWSRKERQRDRLSMDRRCSSILIDEKTELRMKSRLLLHTLPVFCGRKGYRSSNMTENSLL